MLIFVTSYPKCDLSTMRAPVESRFTITVEMDTYVNSNLPR